MTLKDVMAADIDGVFFNTDEFAEEVIIDGKSIPIIKDDDRITEKADVSAMGLSLGERLIFIRKKDMRKLPGEGDQVNIQGKRWYVVNAVENTGVFEIRLSRDRVRE